MLHLDGKHAYTQKSLGAQVPPYNEGVMGHTVWALTSINMHRSRHGHTGHRKPCKTEGGSLGITTGCSGTPAILAIQDNACVGTMSLYSIFICGMQGADASLVAEMQSDRRDVM